MLTLPIEALTLSENKNQHRAPLRPFDMATAVLSTFGLGFLRPAPGTWGSLPPVLVAWGATMFAPTLSALWITLITLVLFSAACVGWGNYAESRFGRKDAPEVVADETAGVCVPLACALLLNLATLPWLLASFALFRLFDIWKPWPVKTLEGLPGGWGVLMDDLAAGGYAAVVIILVGVLAT